MHATRSILFSLFMLFAVSFIHAQDNSIKCESNDGGRKYCGSYANNRVDLDRQISGSPCVQGQTWGVDSRGLWVDRGCRAQFVEMGRGGGGYYPPPGYRPPPDQGGWRPGPDWDREIRLQCESNDKQYHFCQVDVGARGNAVLVRQLSGSACQQGYSWGWNRAGVWVSKGCRGLFSVNRRW